MPGNITLLLLITIALMALIDYIPRVMNAAKKPVPVRPGYDKIPRYLLMPTVYGNINYLKNLAFLRQYADKVLICTSRYESREFYTALRKTCRQYGLRYIAVALPISDGKPLKNAYTIYKGVFQNIHRLRVRVDTPCILIDADTYAKRNVNNLVRAFIKSGLDITSLRCEVSSPKTILEILQAYEYRLAMDNRRMDPWLTSGACNMARAGVFHHVFRQHSHFFAGGDIEIGKLAHVMGYRIGHIDFSFFTEVPSTFRDWYRQRIIWFAGGVRHHMVNMASFSWRHFFIFFYNSLLVYLLLPLRWVEFVNYPLTFVALAIIAWTYIFILNIGRGWRKEYLLLPIYSFMQTMIILPVAMVRYCQYALSQRSLGLLRYDMSHVRGSVRIYFAALNVALASFIVLVAGLFTTERLQYWYVHGFWSHVFVSGMRLLMRA